MRHLVGSVNWSKSKWSGVPSQNELLQSGFSNLRSGYVGNECLNLSINQLTVKEGWKFGAVEKFHQKRRFTDGGLLFLWSKQPKSIPKIYGVLAHVQRLDYPISWKVNDDVGTLEFNLKFPAIKAFAVLFETPLAIKDVYLKEGLRQKKSPGQTCGCYIDDRSAQHILIDTGDQCAALLNLYWPQGLEV